MRWRFADKVTAFEPWTRIEGCKCVSLEEYSLLEPQGREGEFPESLLLECCVQFARWLVGASSGFKQTGELAAVGSFRFDQTVRAGQVIRITATTTSRSDKLLETCCEAVQPSGRVGTGVLEFRIVPLTAFQDPGSMRILWKEIRGQAEK